MNHILRKSRRGSLRQLLVKKIIYSDRALPGTVKCIQLQILMNLTAKVFRVKRQWILFDSYETALEIYARFTKICMDRIRNRFADKTIKITDADEIKKLRSRMYRCSFDLGKRLRLITGLVETEDLKQLVFFLYKNIGIEMSGNCPGTIGVSTCFFSDFYDPEQCRLISAMDAGIICGILGGGKFGFSQRITEGCTCCRAKMIL